MLSNGTVTYQDLIVFAGLESLALGGFCLNIFLLIIFFKFKHIAKPSFIFITSLTIADGIHCIVTSSYFYPPVSTGSNLYPRALYPVWNATDWTAWGITLTHMCLISLDRFVAVMIPQNYSTTVTVKRNLTAVIFCWSFFASINFSYCGLGLCCAVVPLPENYTFGFETTFANGSITSNYFKMTYMPLEVACMTILAIVNPSIIVKLYNRYKEKVQMKRVSVTLLAVATTLTWRGNDATQSTLRQAALREVKVFVQIITVTIVFFVYMIMYYLSFYVPALSSKWIFLFNSFFYSVTHVINPLVYICVNEQMHANAKELWKHVKCTCRRGTQVDTVRSTHSSSAVSQPLITKMSNTKQCSYTAIEDPSDPASSYGCTEFAETKFSACISEDNLAILAEEEDSSCWTDNFVSSIDFSFDSTASVLL